jgi:transposase
MTVKGGTSGAAFLTLVRDYLVATLQPSALVVMDNLGAHHATGVEEALQAAGADVLYLPPYSPDLDPIELCWSRVKSLLRKLSARTVVSLKAAVQAATEAVTQRDAEGRFIPYGFPTQCI